jgi:DNA-binding MarR family transcriptional regulator
MLSLPTDRTSVRNEPSDRALILVVERNPLVQRLEKYFLEQAGYVVEFATDGMLALKKAQELKPRILVTEILTFNDLKALLNTTDGNLSVHARKLEEAGYVSCTKFFEGRMPKTEYKLTSLGRQELENYLKHMEKLIQQVRAT